MSTEGNMNRYRLYTGPTLVATTAARLREAGLTVTCEGTEAVYLTAPENHEQMTLRLRNVLGPAWGVGVADLRVQ